MEIIAMKKSIYMMALVIILMAVFSMRPIALSEIGMPAPEITGQIWLNAQPQRLADLKGKVVLVEFWTFACYNCRNVEPYVKEWHKKYAEKGLVVIGVHSPEFSDEREIKNVQQYIRGHDISYPVVADNDFAIWERYGNHAWPAMYLIDKQSVIRAVRVGEGGYAQMEQTIQVLLAES